MQIFKTQVVKTQVVRIQVAKIEQLQRGNSFEKTIDGATDGARTPDQRRSPPYGDGLLLHHGAGQARSARQAGGIACRKIPDRRWLHAFFAAGAKSAVAERITRRIRREV